MKTAAIVVITAISTAILTTLVHEVNSVDVLKTETSMATRFDRLEINVEVDGEQIKFYDLIEIKNTEKAYIYWETKFIHDGDYTLYFQCIDLNTMDSDRLFILAVNHEDNTELKNYHNLKVDSRYINGIVSRLCNISDALHK
ncbi:hypothetical protein FY036_03420 [Mesorhizobium microcysteis]|uniref:Uncharacterized protein n=1 Tax=Neoaquamicrobium microcysteis TaxID=2682781 RepID=A0A5D4H3Q2_9HYPH|nr:hypothetical protein [Mesorhizobium microcysteis]TYR34883.1 hypothetical protein FY036_03420 [Mesorhizobium microcysteis]